MSAKRGLTAILGMKYRRSQDCLTIEPLKSNIFKISCETFLSERIMFLSFTDEGEYAGPPHLVLSRLPLVRGQDKYNYKKAVRIGRYLVGPQ